MLDVTVTQIWIGRHLGRLPLVPYVQGVGTFAGADQFLGVFNPAVDMVPGLPGPALLHAAEGRTRHVVLHVSGVALTTAYRLPDVLTEGRIAGPLSYCTVRSGSGGIIGRRDVIVRIGRRRRSRVALEHGAGGNGLGGRVLTENSTSTEGKEANQQQEVLGDFSMVCHCKIDILRRAVREASGPRTACAKIL